MSPPLAGARRGRATQGRPDRLPPARRRPPPRPRPRGGDPRGGNRLIAHAHRSAAAAHGGRLVAVLALSLPILAVEVVGGIASNNLALLADAGHMLTDVAGVGMALLAIWFAGRSPTNGRTSGYRRLEILAAVANAFLQQVRGTEPRVSQAPPGR